MAEAIEAETDEQLRRLEYAFASLREHPGSGDPAAGIVLAELVDALVSRPGSLPLEVAVIAALQADAEQGIREHEELLERAYGAGTHLIARLLDLTLRERRASVATLARLYAATCARPAGLPGALNTKAAVLSPADLHESRTSKLVWSAPRHP